MKRRKGGYCRICGEWRRLTNDHVPPYGCYNSGKIETFSFLYNAPKEKYKDGITFESLCENCNSKLLGSKYDPQLVLLVKEVRKFLFHYHYGKIAFGPISVKGNIEKISKSLVGHIIASSKGKTEGNESYEDTTHIKKLISYFKNNDDSFRNEYGIYYWIHIYRSIDIIPNLVYASLNTPGRPVVGSVIKFFPLGIWIVDKKAMANQFSLNLPNLFDQKDNCITIEYKNELDEHFPLSLVNNELKFGAFSLDHKESCIGVKQKNYDNSIILRTK